MAGDLRQADDSSAADWAELEYLLADVARIAKSTTPFDHLARELVDCATRALAAVGGAVWKLQGRDAAQLVHAANLAALGAQADGAEHRQLILEAMRRGQATVLAPHQDDELTNPTGYTLLLAPLFVDQDAVGLIEIVQRADLDPPTLEGNLRFVTLLAELAADHLRRSEIRQLRQTSHQSREFRNFLIGLHQALDPAAAAATLANEGRTLIGCDRASVAIRRGRAYRLSAVSAVDVIHRRSAAVKRLERLIKIVLATGEPLWQQEGDETLAPQVEEALSAYLDESHATRVGIVPLAGPSTDRDQAGPLAGALVVEGFDRQAWDPHGETTREVARHGGLALANALAFDALPALPGQRKRLRRTGPSTGRAWKLLAIAAGVAALAATFVIQVDFYVYAEGQLRPAERRHVFAPRDGQVATVVARHGARVAAGDPLVQMTSPELDLEIQKIQGEHDATMQRALAIDAALLDYGSSVDPQAIQFNQLAAEKEELKQLFASQKKRLAVLREQRAALQVASPIAGDVLTWETDEQLLNRPVARGQRLMTVANLAGPWQAEVDIQDDEAGPLLELASAGALPLAASFELATERGAVHEGAVTRVARRTELDAQEQPIVRAVLDVDASALDAPRPGATVFARIHCGERSLFYVWTRQWLDRVVGWFVF